MPELRVAILGAGSIGLASAAYLADRGHQPVIWSPSGRGTAGLASQPLVSEGVLEGSFRPEIAASCTDAVRGVDAVLVALPANGHKAVYDALVPALEPGQTVIVNAHPALGAFYLIRQLEAREMECPVVAWGTTLLRARQQDPTRVRINTIRKRIDVATWPAGHERALDLCTWLFGDHFQPRKDLLAISLSNLNPQSHLALALTNITRMERAEAWGQGENLTASVARLMADLDAERLAIAEALGLSVRTASDHYHLSYGIALGPLDTMAEHIRARGPGQMGPTTTDSRYVLEDAPYGLVPLVALGRAVGREARLHEAGLALLSSLYGRDFSAENDLLGEIEIKDMVGMGRAA